MRRFGRFAGTVISLACMTLVGSWLQLPGLWSDPIEVSGQRATELLIFSRAVLEGVSPPPVPSQNGEMGRAVVLTAWAPQGSQPRSVRAQVNAPSPWEKRPVVDMVAESAEKLRKLLRPGWSSVSELRLKLDVITRADLPLPARLIGLMRIRPGIDGLWVQTGMDVRVTSLSGQIERDLRASLWMKSNLEVASASSRTLVVRVGGWAAVEGVPEEPGVAVVRRGNVPLPPVGVSRMTTSLREGGEYLARMIDAEGRYCYEYVASRNTCTEGYNLLRHAGSTYSLLQVYRLVGDPAMLEAARRANDWLVTQLRTPADAPDQRYVLEEHKAKLGGAGLGLLSLVEYTLATGDDRYRDVMVGLAVWILARQEPNGDFASYWSEDPSVELPQERSIYYPGEALLGLVRLYGVDPDPRWLSAAVKGADFLVLERWRWRGLELLVPGDAWLTQALVELDEWSPKVTWEDYVFRIIRVMGRLHIRTLEAPGTDLVGGPLGGLDLPPVTPNGTHLEAFTAAWRLARRLGRPGEMAALEELSLLAAQFSLQQQYRPANSWFLPAPARARGGFRERPDRQRVRNDYTQHNLSGLMGVLEILRSREENP